MQLKSYLKKKENIYTDNKFIDAVTEQDIADFVQNQ